MADATDDGSRRALFEISGDLAERLRDPRLVLACVAGVGGALAVFVGWLGVSGTLDPGHQIPYLVSGGVGGLFLLGLAAALLFSADLGAARQEARAQRAEIERLTVLVERLADQVGDLHAALGHPDDAHEVAPPPGATRPRRPLRSAP